jgi:hypothetical protein
LFWKNWIPKCQITRRHIQEEFVLDVLYCGLSKKEGKIYINNLLRALVVVRETIFPCCFLVVGRMKEKRNT